jgi:hypothetical protein
LLPVGWEEHIIQQQEAPGHEHIQRPDQKKEKEKAPAFRI